MLVLDIPRKSPSNFHHIDLPLYHRVHLALAQDVPVHACLLAAVSSPHLPELVISPFDFERWHRIWRLNVSLLDREGLLHDICDTLRNNGANILASESATMEEQNVYHLELILETEDEGNIEWVEWSLKALLLKELTFLPDGNPRLRIRRLQNLWLAKKAYDRQRLTPIGFTPVVSKLSIRTPAPKMGNTANQPSKVNKAIFRLNLPPAVRTILNNTISQRVGDRHDEGYYLRLSDTKDRFMRALFFRTTDPVIHARLEYNERLGAAADVTKALKSKAFNILAAYLGPAEGNKRCRCEVVVRCEKLFGQHTIEVKTAFEDALRSSPEAHDLELVVGYPNDYGKEWDHHELHPILQIQPRTEDHEAHSIKSLAESLERDYKDLYAKISTGSVGPGAVDVRRWMLAETLRREYEGLRPVPHESPKTKSLFVSCHYSGNQLRVICESAKAKGFLVFTGKDLLPYPTMTLGLLTRIKSCTHFLGAWSTDGAAHCGNEFWPSPWLHWEFGVAEAFGLIWRLLISKNISESAWKRVAQNVQVSVFDHDFETKLSEILDVLSGISPQAPLDVRPSTRVA